MKRSGSALMMWSLMLLSVPAAAQSGTDIFLASLSGTGDSLRVGPVEPVTRRAGYDNQPCFTPDGALLYTSIRDGQADVWRWSGGEPRAVFTTPESEYSPCLSSDGLITVVRVEADSSQRLWGFDPAEERFRLLDATLKPVGYYAWDGRGRAAAFVLGDPHYLVVRAADGTSRRVAEDIGRCLAPIPGEDAAISYLQRDPATGWWLKRLDTATGESTPLAPAVPESQDYAWTPDGDLLMASANVLYRWSAEAGPGWVTVARWDPAFRVTRMAVNAAGDRLALVVDEPEP